MKTTHIIKIAVIALGIAFSPAGIAEEAHEHGHSHDQKQKQAGPNGGRVITSVDPHFEFLVTDARKIKITFLGEDGKPVAPKEQSISATGGDRSNPTKFTLAKDGDSLVSDKELPEGNMIPIVLQVKMTPDAKTVTEKFTINLADCPSCKHKEYACTCEH